MANSPVNVLCLLLLVLMVVLLKAVSAELTTTPTDTIAIVNTSTVFQCATNISDGEVFWSRGEGAMEISIYVNGRSRGNKYHVNRTITMANDTSFNLEITHVQPSDAGLYRCLDNNGFGVSASAQLVVLESYPDCSWYSNGLDTAESYIQINGDPVLTEGDVVSLSCHVTYSAAKAFDPDYEWFLLNTSSVLQETSRSQDNNNNNNNRTTTTSSSHVTSLISELDIQAATGDIGVVVFKLYLQSRKQSNFPQHEPQELDHLTWQTPYLRVHYPVRNITVNTSATGTIYVIGQVIECHADSQPPPEYLWVNVQTGETVSEEASLVLDVEGDQEFECRASNVVRNTTHVLSRRVRVHVIDISNKPPRVTPRVAQFSSDMTSDRENGVNVPALLYIICAVAGCVLLVVLGLVLCRGRQRTRRWRRVSDASNNQRTSTSDLHNITRDELMIVSYDDLLADQTVIYDSINDQLAFPELPVPRGAQFQYERLHSQPAVNGATTYIVPVDVYSPLHCTSTTQCAECQADTTTTQHVQQTDNNTTTVASKMAHCGDTTLPAGLPGLPGLPGVAGVAGVATADYLTLLSCDEESIDNL